MAAPSTTYSFSSGSLGSGIRIAQNFTDALNGLTDGTKDLTISTITSTDTKSRIEFIDPNSYEIITDNGGTISKAVSDKFAIIWEPTASTGDITLNLTSPNQYQEVWVFNNDSVNENEIIMSSDMGMDENGSKKVAYQRFSVFVHVAGNWFYRNTYWNY